MRLPICVLLGLSILGSGVGAWAQETADSASTPAVEAPEAAASSGDESPKPDSGEPQTGPEQEDDEAEATEASMDKFVPSEEISADNSISFPVDI